MNIVWKKPDGGISVTHLTKEAISPEHEAAKLKARGDIPADYELIGYRMDIPSDRSYRNAWVHDGFKFDHDMSKAKDLHRNKLRLDRQPLLDSLDIEYQRADEDGDTKKKQTIAKEKKRLRDITKHPDLDLASTTDDLKKIKL